MSSSREESPDWLHSFEAPRAKESILTLSSDSESPLDDSPASEDDKDKEQTSSDSPIYKPSKVKTSDRKLNAKITPSKKRKGESTSKSKGEEDGKVAKRKTSQKTMEPQAPRAKESILTLSSDSESPPDDSPASEDNEDKDQTGSPSPIYKTSKVKTLDRKLNAKVTSSKKRKGESPSKSEGEEDGKVAKRKTSKKTMEPQETNQSVFSLSSDSESGPATSPLRDDNHEDLDAEETEQQTMKEKNKDSAGEPSLMKPSKRKSPKKKAQLEDQGPTETKVNIHMRKENNGDMEVAEEETTEKPIGPYVSSSRVPLVLSEKVQRSKALVECEGEAIDLSGDVGSVGRIVISDNPGDHDMLLDLKGTIYKTTIVPSRTFCVVSFGPSEAKIEAIMNDFIQLEPQSNVYASETMIEGTLEGISFDSDDDAENLPKTTNQTDETEGAEPKANGKGRKKAEKASGATKKKGKAAAKKPPKKVKKKAQAPKKTKTKK